jgi:hypothetical protein
MNVSSIADGIADNMIELYWFKELGRIVETKFD